MAASGFTTIGISNSADSLLDQLHDLEHGQKRELVSNLLCGLLVSEPGIIVAILNAGKQASSAFNSGVNPVLGNGIVFPDGHFMGGFSAKMDVEKLVVSVNAYRDAIKAEQAETEVVQE